jgi:hypothetical protein
MILSELFIWSQAGDDECRGFLKEYGKVRRRYAI